MRLNKYFRQGCLGLDLDPRNRVSSLAVLGLWGLSLACLCTDAVQAQQDPTGPGTVETSIENQGAELEKLLLRTVEPLPLTDIAAADGFFRAKAPAKPATPTRTEDGIYVLSLDFGAGPDQGAECHVHRNHLDPASSLLRSSDLLFAQLAETYGEVTLKTLYGVDAGGIGAAPYWGVDWLYRTAGRGDRAGVAGQAKHLIASKEGRTIYCRSTALGYDDAFFNLFKVLVASTKYTAAAETKPFYEELALVSVGEQVLGVERLSMSVGEEGQIEERVARSLLVPVDGASLQAQDGIILETGNSTGALASKVSVQVVNGRVTTQLRLSRERGENWKVGGVYLGVEIVKELDAVPLRSSYGRRVDFRDFLQSAETGASFAPLGWEPDLDPTLWTKTRLTFDGVDEEDSSLYSFRVQVGEGTSTARMDGNMSRVEAVSPMGVVGMVEQRLFVEGDPLSLPSAAPPVSRTGAEDSGR